MDFVRHDLRIALRSLLRRPRFTVLVVLIFGLGVGATTAMFSVLHGVVLQPLPFSEPDRIVQPSAVGESRGQMPWTGADFVDFQRQSSSYEHLAAYDYLTISMREDGLPARLPGATVTAEFFQVFGVNPLLGRLFSPEADPLGGDPTVVLSHAFWQSRMAADPAVIGQALELNGHSYTVVGVMPQYFAIPDRAILWVCSPYRVPTLAPDENSETDRDNRYFQVVGRLLSGVTPEQAQNEGEAINARLAESNPNTRNLGFNVTPLHDEIVGSIQSTLMMLFGAVAMVLLITVANVASLLLAHATGRAREVAVRSALGAGRGRITSQLLIESTLLAISGGAVGIAMARFGTDALIALATSDLPRATEIGLSLPVLGFSLIVSLLSGILFGFAPAVWLTRGDPATALREAGSRSVAGGGHARLRRALVVAEIGICLALLVGAGLLARTLVTLSTTDPGFSERNAVTAQIWLPSNHELDDDGLRAFQEAVLERARALPGVDAAGAVLGLPVDWGVRVRSAFSIEGKIVEPGTEAPAGLQAASPGYFQAMGIPILQGRAFSDQDGPESEPVVIVSEAFVERFLGGGNPIGRLIGSGRPDEDDFEWWTIIGVVGSTRREGLDSELAAEVYQAYAQAPWPYISLVLSASVDAASLTEPLRQAVMEISPDQPVSRIITLEQVLSESLDSRRFTMLLLGLFAGIALVLAAVGLYGVMSFSVAQRSREIGIRMAVGADASDIRRLVLGEGGRLLAIGLVVGAVGSLLIGRLLVSFLHQVQPTDPAAFIGGATVLSVGALLATWLPARRAVRTDPVDSLRGEA
ncbi:MAG: ABC transporter permease [bacterium]|nr:ABC transporter permease [bacterium]